VINKKIADKIPKPNHAPKAALVFAGVIVFLALLVMVIGRWLTVKKEAVAEHTISI